MSKSVREVLAERRATVKGELDTSLAAATPEARDAATVKDAREGELLTELRAIDARDAELADLEAREEATAKLRKETGPARVLNEARTYSVEASYEGRSFFSDAFGSTVGDYNATERIQRHAREVEVHKEFRATTTGSFAGLVIPQYLVDQAALVLRNGKPLANVVTKLPLPAEGTSFLIPRGTTGAATAVQATENSAVQSTDEVWANVTVPVATIAGQQDVSRQSLERGTPGLDALIYLDIAGAYCANLDSQLISGTGASGQVLGILNTASINAATAFGAAPTAANFTSKLAGQVQAVASAGTAIQPRVVVMHPRRWGWLQSLSDSAGRPLAVATPMGPYNAAGIITKPGGYSGDTGAVSSEAQYVGVLSNGLPVVTDANLPITVGTNVEDVVLVLDTQQMLLWQEGDGMPKQLRFEQTLGASLTVKLVAYGYAAFTAGRYPGAVGKIGGLDSTATFGLVAPTF